MLALKKQSKEAIDVELECELWIKLANLAFKED